MQTGGYGYGRRLVEEEDIVLEPSDPLLEYAEQQLAKADSEQRAAQQAAGGLSAAAVAAMQNSRSSQHTAQLFPIPAGKCYCRYDTDFSTWALAEDSCKDALYSRCKVSQRLSNWPCNGRESSEPIAKLLSMLWGTLAVGQWLDNHNQQTQQECMLLYLLTWSAQPKLSI